MQGNALEMGHTLHIQRICYNANLQGQLKDMNPIVTNEVHK